MQSIARFILLIIGHLVIEHKSFKLLAQLINCVLYYKAFHKIVWGEEQDSFMDKGEEKTLIVYPGAIIEYQEKVAFKIPPSIYPTQVDIKLLYDKNLREFRVCCYQTSVIEPDRRIRGLAALLESKVPVAKSKQAR